MSGMPTRRQLLACASALALPMGAQASDAVAQALRNGSSGGVLMLRHALAPGTFDPPGFKLGDCSTQRNLSPEGRRQAQRIGAWFVSRQLRPARVRSSPWCRCLDTARLAFGDRVEPWAALGSPRAGNDEVNAQALVQLRAELAGIAQRRAGFEVWVTHMFVFSALLGKGAGSGEGALLGLAPDGTPRVLARLEAIAG
jgi:hypothetical protein